VVDKTAPCGRPEGVTLGEESALRPVGPYYTDTLRCTVHKTLSS
jgi:hypothetical protein